MKLLAVTSKSAGRYFPTCHVAESGVPGFEAITWFGLFAPAGTPKPILDLLNAKANAAIQHAGGEARGSPNCRSTSSAEAPRRWRGRCATEIDTWVDIARKRNIKITN